MLKIIIEENELFDEETSSFIVVEHSVIELEHSLLSLSKWESKYQKPFLAPGNKTPDEIVDYILCMVLPNDSGKVVDKETISHFSQKNFDEINAYINSTQSATTFGEMPKKKGTGEVITSELIYYWLVAFTIPFSCETWHLNRLFSLIKIANFKNQKGKKMSSNELAARNRELNAKRRAELGTSG